MLSYIVYNWLGILHVNGEFTFISLQLKMFKITSFTPDLCGGFLPSTISSAFCPQFVDIHSVHNWLAILEFETSIQLKKFKIS